MKKTNEIIFLKRSCALFLSVFILFLIYIFINPTVVCNSSLCDFLFYFLFKVSFIWLILFPIFFTQKIYDAWKKILYISLSLFALNMIFNNDVGDNFFLLSRTSMENIIPIISFIVSLFVVLLMNFKTKIER